MRLLLTSSGLSNQSIANALIDLVGKKRKEITIVFIPTSMNIESGDKSWFINDLSNIKKQDFKCIDIVDISALPKEIWLPRLKLADVIFFSGGNTPHLMRWVKESGLIDLLPGLLKDKVYVGISAGSVITAPNLFASNKDKRLYYEKTFGYKSNDGLGFVNFYFRPHLNSLDFPNVRKEKLEILAKELTIPLYALDDQSALKINGDQIDVISEGKYLKL
jgi:dipeptidase E